MRATKNHTPVGDVEDTCQNGIPDWQFGPPASLLALLPEVGTKKLVPLQPDPHESQGWVPEFTRLVMKTQDVMVCAPLEPTTPAGSVTLPTWPALPRYNA